MPDISRAAKVGALIIVLTVAGIYAYRFISRETGTAGGYTVWAHLPDVTGVAPKSRVMISGIQVGVVDKIWLDEGKARVDVKMKPEVALYVDAAIGKKATSLIGEYYIVLAPGTEGRDRIPDGGQIVNYIDEPTIESIQGQVADILNDIKKVSESLGNTVGSDQGQAQIADILENLAEVTEQLEATVRENRAAVRDTINNVNAITGDSRPQIAAILENVRVVTDEVRVMTAAAGAPGPQGEPGQPGEIRSAVERINRASANLESMLAHADNVAARIDRGEGTIGRLTKDEELINEVENVVSEVGDLVGGIGRLKTVVGLRTDYNFLSNSIKSYVELRLQPAEDKYYAIEVVNDPRGKSSFEQIVEETDNPNQPNYSRLTRVTTTNDFRFSFQFAKRMGPFTGRFGIKESTGGIGLDVHLLEDRLELRQDVFGFGEQLGTRWRVTLGYEFVRKLWLLGGADDILNADGRDYHVGLQLRFTDDDLKTILPFAPAGP